jgi:DNA-binding transcriptional ArsR family regulator
VKTDAPPLLPIFRSDGQARLLAHLYLRPERATTLSALARELDLSHTTLSREADKLERAGLIRSERVGNQRRLHPNEESVYFPALRDLLLRAFGPVPLMERALRRTDGVEKAFLYGSWAARYLGEAGDAPNDLDLLVVGSPQRSALARVARDLEHQLGYEINPTVVPAEEWEAKKSGFLQSVARGPLVELDLIE